MQSGLQPGFQDSTSPFGTAVLPGGSDVDKMNWYSKMTKRVGEAIANELSALICHHQCWWSVVSHPLLCKGSVDRIGLLVGDRFDDLHVRAPA